MTYYAQWFPIDRFLLALCAGWNLPFIVEPAVGHHGVYSILLVRDDEP